VQGVAPRGVGARRAIGSRREQGCRRQLGGDPEQHHRREVAVAPGGDGGGAEPDGELALLARTVCGTASASGVLRAPSLEP
jgi:hypothetical protein